MKIRLAVMVAWLAVAAACTASGQRATILTTTTVVGANGDVAPTTTDLSVSSGLPGSASTPTTVGLEEAAEPVEYGPAADDRLVVTTEGGSVLVMDPDGGNQIVLREAGAGAAVFPVWAPSGERVAWTETGEISGQPAFSVVTTNIDGSSRAQMRTPFASYYTAWDSSSQLLGVLGNDSQGEFGTALAVGRADRDALARTIDGGTPSYYFSWEPDAPVVIAHNSEGVRRVEGGEETLVLGAGQGLYQPPLLTGDPGIIVFGEGGADLGVLVLADLEAGAGNRIAFYRGGASMMMHPDGTKLAVQSTGSEGELSTDLVLTDGVPLLDPGLVIIDLVTGDLEQVDDELVLAFFWSPDGQKLLVADFEVIDGESFFQWKVHEDGALRTLGDLFIPSAIYGGRIIPFFDQYGLSSTPWSPDSTRFTYSARDDAGENAVWVYDIVKDSVELVFEGGTLAFWSPT